MSISLKDCIGHSFDDAADMSGQYNGVHAQIKEAVNNHIHVWCYVHILSLMLADVISIVITASIAFILLNTTGNFFNESHKSQWMDKLP